MAKTTLKNIDKRIDDLESDIKEKADEVHFHPVLTGVLIGLIIIIIVGIIVLNYHPTPNIDSCLDKLANNYCINHNMTFEKGHYGHYVLADDNSLGNGDFTCRISVDKHIMGEDSIKEFRFTMEEAKSCGYKS